MPEPDAIIVYNNYKIEQCSVGIADAREFDGKIQDCTFFTSPEYDEAYAKLAANRDGVMGDLMTELSNNA